MITTVTLNASVDKAYHMEKAIENGTVMRVASCRNSAGGKGLNVARAAKLCGADIQATGFVGGFNGKYLESMLEKDGIPYRFIHVSGETRSCINILDERYGSTEYLEPGCVILPEEEEKFMEEFPEIVKESKVVTVSGSIPKGVSKDICGRIVMAVKKMGKQVILDTSGDSLKEGMKACPTMVKPNQDEIEQLFDVKIEDVKDVITYATQIHQMGIPYVVVSLGKDGALLVCKKGVFQGKPPEVEAVNTVGCGDSMVGAFAVALERKYAPQEAIKYAVAVATANAISPNTGDFEQKQYLELINNITIKRL